jgi:hypothetical protein
LAATSVAERERVARRALERARGFGVSVPVAACELLLLFLRGVALVGFRLPCVIGFLLHLMRAAVVVASP